MSEAATNDVLKTKVHADKSETLVKANGLKVAFAGRDSTVQAVTVLILSSSKVRS